MQDRQQAGFHRLGLLLAAIILVPGLIAAWQWWAGRPGSQGLNGVIVLCVAAAGFYLAARVLGWVLASRSRNGP